MHACVDQRFGLAARYDFDAAHACGRTGFVRHAEIADLCRHINVCAAAEFHAHAVFFAKGDDTHGVAVLFTEEGHGAFLDGAVIARLACVDIIVGQHDLVGTRFDVVNIFLAQRQGMGKVEAQALWRDQRAGLMHVIAQPLAQCRVQYVGGRVVAHDVPAPLGVDDGLGRVADLNRAAGHRAAMNDQAGQRTRHACHLDRPNGDLHALGEVVNLARVGDLTAAFHVEGRRRQDDFDFAAGVGPLDNLAVDQQAHDFAGRFGHVFVDEVFNTALRQLARFFERLPEACRRS